MPRVDLEVRPEQLDHRSGRRGLPIGGSLSLQHEPAMHAVGTGELVEQPRLPNACFSHHCGNLSVTISGPLEGLVELCELRITPDEPGEATSGSGLQACAG